MPIDEDTLRTLLNRSMDRPNAARVYDYYLGGAYNFEQDRDYAKRMTQIMPRITTIARENRRYLHRVVRSALDAGVHQFIDIGCGLPTQDAVHHIGDAHSPNISRVLYVDNDPIAHAHSHYLLEEGGDGFGAVNGVPRFAATCENFYDPGAILAAAERDAHMDLSRPVCVLLMAVLHFLEHPEPALASYRDKLAPGSWLAVSHICDEQSDEAIETVRGSYDNANASARFRSREEIAALFADWPLLDPGKAVWVPEWHADQDTAFTEEPWQSGLMGGVAVKPAG